jgi:hypothetical protein
MRILIALLLYIPSIVFACYCGSATVEEKVAESDFIYVGIVVKSYMDNEKVIHNTLVVDELIKGDPESLSFTNETLETSLCAQSTSVGVRYLVFGNYGSPVHLSSCSYTQSLHIYGSEGLASVREEANKSVN